jgi:hypothetical protein
VPAATSGDAAAFDWARARYERVQEHITRELAASGSEESHGHDGHGSEAGELEAGGSLCQVYAAYHALINEQCVRYCTARRPRCDGPPGRRVYSVQKGRESYLDRRDGCPLREVCAFYQQRSSEQQ